MTVALRPEAGRALAYQLTGPVFDVGERVVSRDDYGPLICSLALAAKDRPHAEYTVIAVEGNWIAVMDDDLRIHGSSTRYRDGRQLVMPSIGSSYFAIAGPCGLHSPTYDSDAPTGWRCRRCDLPTPEASSRYWLYHRSNP